MALPLMSEGVASGNSTLRMIWNRRSGIFSSSLVPITVPMKPAKIMLAISGSHSTNAAADLRLTRDYLLYLREQMGKAVEEMVPFEEAYARTDWSRYSKVPAFEAANRINAYGSYLTLERESLAR